MVEAWIQEEQCRSHADSGTVQQIFTLVRVCEEIWECVQDLSAVTHSVLTLTENLIAVSGALFCGSKTLFTDDMVLLVPLCCDGFAAGMKISTSRSEAIVLSQKQVDCPPQGGNEALPSTSGLSWSFVHEWGRNEGTDRSVRLLQHLVLCALKRELSWKSKLCLPADLHSYWWS